MHDFDYDVIQKKRIASGAVHRKRGSKSKKCTLPSDFLSKKELKAMNGEVTTYNIHERMSWKKFKTLPEDVAIEHINWLVETFGCNTIGMADAFGVSDKSVSKWLRDHKVKLPYRRFMGSKEWLTFLGKMPVVEPEVVEETVEEATEAEESSGVRTPEPDPDATVNEAKITRGSFILEGSKAHMLQKLFDILPDDVCYLDVSFINKQ